MQVGIYDDSLPGVRNKMRLCPEGFRTLGNVSLQRCAETDSEWIFIDEIGYLETGCGDYCNEIR